MACNCNQPAPSAPTAQRMIQTSPLGGSGVQRIATDPYDHPNGPPLREPIGPGDPGYVDPSSTAASDGSVNFDDGTTVDAHSSPLGQALQKLAAVFTGSTS